MAHLGGHALDLVVCIQWYAQFKEALGGSQEALVLGFKRQ
jgi:hypothetical protein